MVIRRSERGAGICWGQQQHLQCVLIFVLHSEDVVLSREGQCNERMFLPIPKKSPECLKMGGVVLAETLNCCPPPSVCGVFLSPRGIV